jgi:hypothetical protein
MIKKKSLNVLLLFLIFLYIYIYIYTYMPAFKNMGDVYYAIPLLSVHSTMVTLSLQLLLLLKGPLGWYMPCNTCMDFSM